MAPVQTFSSSPITAAKAPTATAQPQQSPTAKRGTPANTTAAPSASASRYGPPSAQPVSRPPAPTGAFSGSPPSAAITASGHVQATPTQRLSSSDGPPPPQPGAVPTPPGGASSTLPPPPKKGETLGPEHTIGGAALSSDGYPPPTTMPAQMSYPPPQASHAIRGTSTTSAFPSPYEHGPVQLPVGTGLGGGINLATDMSHPPGYQQDVHAAEFSSGQRAAHNAYVAQNSDFGSSFAGGGGDGVDGIWNTAKKWASAAGDKLAEAEGEVWKAVNKDQK